MAYTLLEQVKIRLGQYHTEDVSGENVIVYDKVNENILLNLLIEKARADVIACRNYPATYKEVKIERDLEKQSNIIVDLVIYDYNLQGAEYETAHSENSVSRRFISRDAILGRVSPYVKVL